MKQPRFSITVPAFKAAYLQECIESILAQTLSDFELIIVNDHSPEDLDMIINQFSDSRIRYHKNSIGFGGYDVSKNWDKCLSLAQGEYFMCLGDDDKLLPDCLEKYQRLIELYPEMNVYHAGTQLINERSDIIDLQESRPVRESSYSMIWHRWFNARKTYIGDFLFKTDALKEIGGFIWVPYAWGSDEQTVYQIALKNGIANMQGYGFQYRVSTQSISGSPLYYKEKAEAYRLVKEWYREFLKEKPSDPTDQIFWNFLRNGLDWYFSDCYKSMVKKDFRDNRLQNLFYWFKNRKQYQLTQKDIWFHLFLGIKQRVKAR